MGRKRVYSKNATSRVCRLCERDLPVSNFNPDRIDRRGYLTIESRCNECRRAQRNGTTFVHLPARADRLGFVGTDDVVVAHRLFKYGLTVDQFNDMIVAQDGKCGICQTDLGEKFCIDHCHETGEVRGLLCSKCNLALGGLGDNIAGLQRAIAYLS